MDHDTKQQTGCSTTTIILVAVAGMALLFVLLAVGVAGLFYTRARTAQQHAMMAREEAVMQAERARRVTEEGFAQTEAERPPAALQDDLPEQTEKPTFSDWMSGEVYQKLFQSKTAAGFYPVEVEGTSVGSESRFRARFVSKPQDPDFGFYSFHGVFEADYGRRTSTYKLAGFREVSVHSFVDAAEVRRFSGTWVRETRNSENGVSDEQGQ